MTKPTVLITGGGIGIGHATAKAFANAGYHVVVTDILEKEGSETVAEIEGWGGSAEFHTVDVTSTENVDEVVKAAEERHGPFAAAVANAGIAHKVKLEVACDLGADRVRINGMAPGFIRTAQALSVEHSVGPEGLERAAEYIPLGRVGEPGDIADVILFLCSEAARYMTGQTVIVDGGLMVGRY
jgi:NAD(P)-dependent dehydrogenase (short-subunit alcohol dehydrogenase family)